MVQHTLSRFVLPVSVCFVSLTAEAFELFVADASRDAVYALIDGDGSGCLQPEEVSIVYGDEAAGPDLSTPADLWWVGETLYLLDGGTLDMVLRLTDTDGDGRFFGADEVMEFFGPGCEGPRLRTPNRLFYRDGVFGVVDDSKVRALVVLLQDHDGDGAACAAGESHTIYDGDQAQVVSPPLDPEAFCQLPDTTLLVGDAADGSIRRLADVDDDGLVAGDDEITIFYAPPPGASPPRFSCLVPSGPGVLAADRAHGLVLYLEDADGDGLVGEDETAIFCGGSAASPYMAEPADLWLDTRGGLWIIDNGTDQILYAADRNGDGDALDPGELLVVLADRSVLSQPTSLVVVSEPDGEAPHIEGLSAGQGMGGGGDSVTIAGEYFVAGTSVYFGETPALEVELVDADTLAVVTPPGSGIVDVTVASVFGRAVLENAWSYETVTLTVDRMEPAEGPAAGGYEVRFHGRGLKWAHVWFDGIAGEVVSSDTDLLVAVVPSHAAGEVAVLVTNGTEEVVLAFTYLVGGSFMRGYVDGGGDIAINDAILILSILFADGGMPPCSDRADVNDDGTVNIADAINLLGYLFGGGESPPPPFPVVGEDPTDDALVCE